MPGMVSVNIILLWVLGNQERPLHVKLHYQSWLNAQNLYYQKLKHIDFLIWALDPKHILSSVWLCVTTRRQITKRNKISAAYCPEGLWAINSLSLWMWPSQTLFPLYFCQDTVTWAIANQTHSFFSFSKLLFHSMCVFLLDAQSHLSQYGLLHLPWLFQEAQCTW